MAQASFAIPNFLGGEISQFAQGRFDKPDYRTSLRACINWLPLEIGPLGRRPGTMFAGTTLGNKPGRVIEFDVKQASPNTCEYTDGNLQIRFGATVIQSLTTPYTSGSWSQLRVVQAENTQVLLNPAVAPQALVLGSSTFSLGPVTFNDGPYLDPFTNGVLATPGSLSGIVTLALSFPVYSATTAYPAGSFVTYSGNNYVSLADQNVGHTPTGGAPWWATTSASAAINGGKGFLGTDIGRLVRLFSEPPAWAAGTTYTKSAVVGYNPTGIPGASTYWSALVGSNVGNVPGIDLVNWQLMPQGAAIWTWGKIASLSNLISPSLSGSTNIGTMTGGGGLAGAFNGSLSQAAASSAEFAVSGTGFFIPSSQITVSSFVGKNYTGASNQAIQHATVYPSSDNGFASGSVTIEGGGSVSTDVFSITFNLRGKASNPANSADGTLLGTSGALSNPNGSVNIVSSDQSTTWAYVWIEQVTVATFGGATDYTAYTFTNIIGQASFYSPTGTGTGSGVNVEILGAPLLYATAIQTWRLGLFTTGSLPTCGVFDDGRIWLGGAASNRVDACYANGINGSVINFAPTDQYGQVTAAHAISYTFNSKGVNPVFWMKPDLQGIKVGTQAGEWLIGAPTAGGISPLNISAHQATNHGSANIEPVDTEHTLIFVQRGARKLLEYFPDIFSGKFSAPNLADKTIRTKPGVAELAYTSAVTPILWARMTDGTWGSVTYKRDSLASSQPPTFYAWAGQTLGSGRVVESICKGASVGGNLDALTMVTNDPATGLRWVEILTDTQDEESTLAQSQYLDASAVPNVTIGATGVTLSGLPYRNSSTVQAFCAGLDLGDPGDLTYPAFNPATSYSGGAAVSSGGVNYFSRQNANLGNTPATSPAFWQPTYIDFFTLTGAIFVPYGDGISAGPGKGLFTQAFAKANKASFLVGFTYNSDVQIVRPILPQDSGARSGPAVGKIQRVHKYALQLVNALGLQIGRDFDHLRNVNLRTNPNDPKTVPAPLTTFSGIAFDSIADDYGRNGSPCVRASRPLPATIVALDMMLETADE